MTVLMVLAVATLLFAFIHLIPGDPAEVILGSSETNHPSPEQIAMVRQKLGLDRPLTEQYLSYMGGLARGDMGVSFLTGRSVALDLRIRFMRTLVLVVPAILISSVAGVLLGVLAALKRGRWADSFLSTLGLVGHSLPSFVIANLLVLVFSIQWKLLPSSGFVEFSQDPKRFISYMILPVLAMAVGRIGSTMRMTRMSMVEQLLSDYVRTARAKGLTERVVVYRHVLRNALLPVVTVIGLQLGAMFAGAMIVEQIFNWPGLNRLLLNAITNRDYPLIQGAVMLTSTIFMLTNLATDLTYAWLNPRIRYS